MSALERAEQDALNGDFALARQRMETYLNTKGYNADLLERLGDISMRMHDPYSAGRYWLTSSAPDEKVNEALDVFLSRAGVCDKQIVKHLPLVIRGMEFNQFPGAAQERLLRLGLGDALPVPSRPRSSNVRYKAGPVGKLIAIAVLLFTIGSCSIGVKQIVSWMAE